MNDLIERASTCLDRLENSYKFDCEACSLAMCRDFIQLKAAIEEIRKTHDITLRAKDD